MEIGFDIIGDLYLSPNDEFNWEGKPTSLYCIVTGNVSSDIGKLQKTLKHLSECYKGVFYVTGSHEFDECNDIHDRIHTINHICQRTENLASLWHHVVILENIAIVGCNGWTTNSIHNKKVISHLHHEDLLYLKNSIKKLQTHGDVEKIIVISNSVPSEELYFNQVPNNYKTLLDLNHCIESDTEKKIKYWAFGNNSKPVNVNLDSINYVNNPYYKDIPYWPKRIGLEF